MSADRQPLTSGTGAPLRLPTFPMQASAAAPWLCSCGSRCKYNMLAMESGWMVAHSTLERAVRERRRGGVLGGC